jgi:hypothetical protein
MVHSANPVLVDGCRPIEAARFISGRQWEIEEIKAVRPVLERNGLSA